jgi:hypothetical protein
MVSGEVVLRPGAAPYRARKTPVAEVLGDSYETTSVIVWRTHDMDVAVALAGGAWRHYVDGGELPGGALPSWFKVVPWDALGGGCDYTVIEVEPTERGAVPAVMFR